MVILNSSDYFQVIVGSLVADYDQATLIDFYQPLMGYQGLAIYYSLLNETHHQEKSSLIQHEDLFLTLKMAPGDFIKTRKSLEALGLIKTYLAKTESANIYTYIIYAPKTPKEFLEDTLLHGTLIKFAGDSYVKRLKDLYSFSIEPEYGNDVSVQFSDIFTPNYDDPVYIRALETGKTISRNKSALLTGFNYETFFAELKKVSQLTSASFSSKEMKEIDRLSSLNGISEEIIAKLVAREYNHDAEKGKRIDFDSLTLACQEETNYAFLTGKKSTSASSKLSSKTELASKINIMETYAPKNYLSVLQNGTKAALSDLRIIDTLSKDFNLPNGVINAIIDFVLAVNNNILSRAYTEKIAASVAREGITTTLDTMNYLKNSFNKKKTSYTSNKITKRLVNEVKEDKVSKEKQNELSIDEIIARFEEDDTNGKA